MQRCLLIIISLFLISCGASKEDKTTTAIDRALTYLTTSRCNEALDALSEGRDLDNPIYLQVLSSAHACKAGVLSIEVITEFQNIDAQNMTDVLYELTLMSFSFSDTTRRIDSLKESIATIVESTEEGDQASRKIKFGAKKSSDLGMQALIYSLAQIAKFSNYYGNIDNGKKGAGSGSNTCFLDYSSNQLIHTYITNMMPAQNACKTSNDPHPGLDISTRLGRASACQGIISVNTTLDTLAGITFGDSQELSIIKEISEIIGNLRDTILTLDSSLSDLFEVYDEESCMALSDDHIQMYIFGFYELELK